MRVGGVSNICLINNADGSEELEVVTARGDNLYHYTLDGKLLTTKKYDYKSELYDTIGNTGEEVYSPFAWWKVGLLHPFAGWLVGALGMLLLFISELLGKRGRQLAGAHTPGGTANNSYSRSMASSATSSSQAEAEFAEWLKKGEEFKRRQIESLPCKFSSEYARIVRRRRGSVGGWIFFGIWFGG